jgi:Ca2+-transporting ATPase
LSWSILQNPWIIGGLAVSILLQSAVIFYRPLGDLFYTTPLTADTLIAIVALASLVLWIEELRKFVVRRRDDP